LSQDVFDYEQLQVQARENSVPIRRVRFNCDWQTYKEAVLYPHEIEKVLAEQI
jgi:hypothetical protein